MSGKRTRHGFTLAELIVVIVILGVMAAITGIAFTAKAPLPLVDPGFVLLAAARDSAVRSGRVVTMQLEMLGGEYLVTGFPDGRVESDAPVVMNPLSGRKASAQQ